MLKINESSLDDIYANDDRTFNFKLTDKKAKSNLLKSANRPQFEIEMKQQSLNLKFSAGAYLLVAQPLIKEFELYFKRKTSFTENGMETKVLEFRAGKELNDKHFDTKIVFLVNTKKVTMHCYNSTQNIMVNGSCYLEFVDKLLEPFFLTNVAKRKVEINEYDKTVISSLNARGRPLKARSVRNIRSAIQQVDFKCKKCGDNFTSHGQLMRHKVGNHANSFNLSNNSSLSVKHSTRNNLLEDEMLLCDDITINDDNTNKEILEIEYVETFKCKICEREFPESQDLAIHEETHTPHTELNIVNTTKTTGENESKIKCRKCEHTFREMKYLDEHMEMVHSKKVVFKCQKCTNEFRTILEMEAHMERDHAELEELTCRKCNFEGTTVEAMKEHTTDKHPPNKCSICEHKSKSEDELSMHIKANHIQVSVQLEKIELPQTISCNECKFTCRLNIQMKKHKEKEHIDKQKTYECNFCGFESNLMIKMYEHKFNVHPEIPIDSKTADTTPKDFIINMLAEQNMAMMEEICNLRNDLKNTVTLIESESRKTENANKALSAKVISLENIIKNKIEVSRKVDGPSISVPPPQSTVTSTPPPSPPNFGYRKYLKRKTTFLKKPKVLYIGDSVAHNADFAHIERVTKSRIRTVKSYSSVQDRARWPSKNIADVTESSLQSTQNEDPYTHLILSAPTEDISNLNTSKYVEDDNTEALKQNVIISCKNMFTTAQNALTTHPELQKVVITEHAPRSDPKEVDPLGLKTQLAKFANATFNQLWLSCPMKNRIQIGSHRLHDVEGSVTGSILHILNSALPVPNQTRSSYHDNCPQTRYQMEQRKTTIKAYTNKYEVPLSNRFEVLGN